jgi:hypothetical protein
MEKHVMPTYSNRKKEEVVIHVVLTKTTKPIAKITTQPIKPTNVPL